MLRATVFVRYRAGVDDPEGKHIKKALNLLGFSQVRDVGVAKTYEILLDVDGEEEAARLVEDMARKLLVNPVIHDYEVRFQRV